MKRIFGFLVLAVLFAGCDDGDMQEVSFEFNDASALACNVSGEDKDFFIYKTTDQRALILQLSEKNFSNTVSLDTLNGAPIELDIDARNKLIYRVYSDNVNTSTICSAIPASYPIVTEERSATGGTISIVTTAIKSDITDQGATRITDYVHTMTFSDITFDLGDGIQRNETLPSITYTRKAPSVAVFDGLAGLKSCSNSPRLHFKLSTSTVNNADPQAMLLRLSDAAIATLFTEETDVPKIAYFDTENTLTHLYFGSTATNPLNDAYICSTETPAFPSVKDSWRAANGVENTSGIIEVVTTSTETGFKHTITFRNVKMVKGSQDYLLKSEFIFGEYTVTTP